jgi:hypothetical protein
LSGSRTDKTAVDFLRPDASSASSCIVGCKQEPIILSPLYERTRLTSKKNIIINYNENNFPYFNIIISLLFCVIIFNKYVNFKYRRSFFLVFFWGGGNLM